MENQRNLLVAVVLSAIVFLGWTWAANRYFPVAAPPATAIRDGRQVALPSPDTPRPAVVRDRRAVLAASPRVTIVTPRLAGSVDLRGARLDDLVLLDHRQTVAPGSPPVRLLSPGGAPDAYFAQWGWSGAGVALPGPDTLWRASGPRLTPATPVTLSWDNGQGQRFLLALSVDADYLFTVRATVANAGPAPVTVRPYGLVSRTGPSKDPSSWTMHTGPIGAFDGSTDYSIGFKDLDKAGPAGERFDTAGGWLGFGDKYWQTALVAPASGRSAAGFRAGGDGAYQADLAPPALTVPPGHAASVDQRFFAGAKEVAVLDRYERAGVPQFDRAIDWGWFVWFEKPIFYLLDWLFRHVGNFGVAIVLLTCVVRACLFPVAQRQFSSMASMRRVQPKMKALQERYKEDKPRLQQEVMQLYKQEKVNPLAGCLPIFIQMPIFIALYKVLMLSIEMRHQPFVAWIRDLSAPDPLTPVNLFGFLPFTPPPMLHLGVLAIVLGVVQWLQFRISPAQMDPSQQQVMQFMPWLMMLFFAPLAAGLQLYYVANNLLSLAQQQFLYARTPGLGR